MFSLEGLFDLHIHAGPDLVERLGDDMQFAIRGRDAGMAGMAVKAMLENTVSRAYYVNMAVPGFRMVGGVCLNYSVGGINPAAVDTALRAGGRIVWMPTAHARFHAELKGELGSWGHAGLKLYNPPGVKGISILNEDGSLTREMRDVVEIVGQHRALIGTSHLSPEEIVKLAAYCRGEGVKMIVNHLGWTPAYDLALAKEVVAHGGHIELTAVTFGGFTHKMAIADAVKIIAEIGVERIVLATDAGAIRFPTPSEMLRTFGENLLLQGVKEADIRRMMRENPLALISDAS